MATTQQRKPKEPHVCRYTPTCQCYMLALEPADECPIHGSGPAREACDVCGRFMKSRRRAEAEAIAAEVEEL
jgi:hypothetical protein